MHPVLNPRIKTLQLHEKIRQTKISEFHIFANRLRFVLNFENSNLIIFPEFTKLNYSKDTRNERPLFENMNLYNPLSIELFCMYCSHDL